jgi:hypothetical protein
VLYKCACLRNVRNISGGFLNFSYIFIFVRDVFLNGDTMSRFVTVIVAVLVVLMLTGMIGIVAADSDAVDSSIEEPTVKDKVDKSCKFTPSGQDKEGHSVSLSGPACDHVPNAT